MKKFLIILMLFVFMAGCASLGVKAKIEEPQTFKFPIIGDINFNLMPPPNNYVSREYITPDLMATIVMYPDKKIGPVRILTNTRFRVRGIQYFKNGELFVYETVGDDSIQSTYGRKTDISKEEEKEIAIKFMFPKAKQI